MDWVQGGEKQNYFTIFTIASMPEIYATQSGIESGFFCQKKITMSKLILLRYDCLVPAEALVRKDGLVQNPQRRGGWLFRKNDPPAIFAKKRQKLQHLNLFWPSVAETWTLSPEKLVPVKPFWGKTYLIIQKMTTCKL